MKNLKGDELAQNHNIPIHFVSLKNTRTIACLTIFFSSAKRSHDYDDSV